MSFVDRFIQEKLENDPEFKKEWEKSEVAFQVAHQIIRYRRERGWTQEELARRLGTTQSVISRIENGENVSVRYLDKIARALGKRLHINMVDEEAAATIRR